MSDRGILLIAVLALCSLVFATMTNIENAAAKDAEGRLESAYGELTGDTGHQIKGKAKQVEASVINVVDKLKDGIQSAAEKAAGAAKKLSEDLS